MSLIKIEWLGIVFFFLILISIQYSLNKIIVLLKEIRYLLHNRK